MSYYLLSAVRLDASERRVTHVLWERLGSSHPVDYNPTEATVLEVVNALSCGDHVHLLVEEKPEEQSIGPEFHTVVYPGGAEGIELNDYALTDLPTF